MQRDAQSKNNQPIDREAVADIAREVLARLATMAQRESAATIDDRIISVDTLLQFPEPPKQISIRPDAVVTPAAREEARRRGIELKTTNDVPGQRQFDRSDSATITDTDQPQRAAVVHGQLARRGIDLGSTRIVLSDRPAVEVWRQCSSQSERAAMVAATGDVERFQAELDPTIWVLDMKRLNLVAAVNVIAAITRMGSTPK